MRWPKSCRRFLGRWSRLMKRPDSSEPTDPANRPAAGSADEGGGRPGWWPGGGPIAAAAAGRAGLFGAGAVAAARRVLRPRQHDQLGQLGRGGGRGQHLDRPVLRPAPGGHRHPGPGPAGLRRHERGVGDHPGRPARPAAGVDHGGGPDGSAGPAGRRGQPGLRSPGRHRGGGRLPGVAADHHRRLRPLTVRQPVRAGRPEARPR